MNTPATMKIQVMGSSTLMGLVDTVEVRVLATVQVEIAGVYELFCIHPSHVRGADWFAMTISAMDKVN